MKRRQVLAMGMAASALAVGGVAALGGRSARAQGAGWTTLFDGKSLDHFTPIGDANWRIENGIAVADKGKMGFLVTKEVYKDFQIRAEFWVDDDANSGIFIRCTDPKEVGSKNSYEVNIFDKRPDPSYGTGAIVNVAKAATVLKAGGKWNTYDITAKGSHFHVVLNGTTTVADAENADHPQGHIALQYGAGVVKFRKVEIRKL
jgi:Domain of Unknown Function (DUF1080)